MAEAFGIACHELVSLDFRCGSFADIKAVAHLRPLSGVKQTSDVRFLSPRRSCASECPLSGVKQTLRRRPPHVRVSQAIAPGFAAAGYLNRQPRMRAVGR